MDNLFDFTNVNSPQTFKQKIDDVVAKCWPEMAARNPNLDQKMADIKKTLNLVDHDFGDYLAFTVLYLDNLIAGIPHIYYEGVIDCKNNTVEENFHGVSLEDVEKERIEENHKDTPEDTERH